MKKHRDALFIILMFTIFVLILMPSLFGVIPRIRGAIGPIPPENLRKLAIVFLNTTFNLFNKMLWTASPEAVAAIVWDYRGLDTLYETIVFYTAIIGCLALYREVLGKVDISKGEGLSFIVKKVTAIAMAGIAVVGASTVLHGMLTPGGGFQGGAILAVAPTVAIVVFSRLLIDKSRLTYGMAIAIRNMAIIGIVLVILIPFVFTLGNAFVFQNQPKNLSMFSYPSQILDVPMGGTIWFLNLFEGLAVFAAFYLAFKVILYSESTAKELIEGEDYGY